MNHDTVLDDLTSGWVNTRHDNLEMFEDYYLGNHPANLLSAEEFQNPEFRKMWKIYNICNVVVNEPVGYLAHAKIKVQNDNPALEAWATSFLNRRIRPRLSDIVIHQGLYGEAFLYFWTDYEGASRGLKAKAIAPIEAGKRRVIADYGGEDDEEITAAEILYSTPVSGQERTVIDYKATLTAKRLRVVRLENSRVVEVVRDEANLAKVLPIIPIFNPTASDILQLLPVQDDLNRLHYDMRWARRFHGFPIVTMEPVPGVQIPPNLKLKIAPGQVLGGGKFGRLEPGDITQLLAERDAILESAAMLTFSLILARQSGGQLSGVALRYLQQALESKMLGKAQKIAGGLENALAVAARLCAQDRMLYGWETAELKQKPSQEELRQAVFGVTVEPRIPADEKAQAERAIMLHDGGLATRRTAMSISGAIDNPTEEEAALKLEREQAMTPPKKEAGTLDKDDDLEGDDG